MRQHFYPVIPLFIFITACGSAPVDESPDATTVPSSAEEEEVDTTADAGTTAEPSSDAGESGDDVGGLPRDDAEVPADAVTLGEIHTTVFVEQGCTSGYCHASFALDSPEAVQSAFVGVEAPTPTCGRTQYVVPGEPEQSILWLRVRPITDEDRECGQVKMPKGSETGLDADNAQLIHDWITDGALL